ncbi:MAG: HDOD domain-containing protein [Bryobacteraceae bacterium]
MHGSVLMLSKAARQQRLAAWLNEIRQCPDFPAFAHQISQLMQALGDEEASLRRLTGLILKDFSLTLKILRTANSAHYNRSGKPIVSVSHAVALLGADAIRNLAGSLLLLDHYHRHSPGLKQLMLLSLLTAAQARETAARVGYPRREEAYICGMFHNLGEVLVACYQPAQYASILLLMKERRLSEPEASLNVLGFTYPELAQAASREWNLPERVIQTMDPQAWGAGRGGTGLLATITAFSHNLTVAVHRSEPATARARLRRLTEEFGPTLGLDQRSVREIVEAGLLETKETLSILRVPLDELRLKRQAEAVLDQVGELAARPEPGALGAPLCGQAALEHLANEIEWVLLARKDWELTQVIFMVLEAIYRSEVFDRVLFCLLDPASETLLGRVGLGEGVDGLRERLRLPTAPGASPLSQALANRRAILLSATSPLSEEEAGALRERGISCLGLFPIVVDGVLVGCLYGERAAPGNDPDARTFELLNRLRLLASRAIALSRQAHRTAARTKTAAPALP